MGVQDLGRQLENLMTEAVAVSPSNQSGGAPPFLNVTTGLQGESFTDSITAFAGGGQTSATKLTTQNNRVTTVASQGDSVQLPASQAGMFVTVANDAATNAMDVFPATGDIIRPLAANTAVRISAGSSVAFFCPVAGKWVVFMPPLAPSQFVTGTTTTTFAAGQLTGAEFVNYTNTQATPGTINTRTATQMFNDMGNILPGQSYTLMITNGQGTGTLTVGAGSGVTLTGTMTIAINTWRLFIVTFNTATTATIQNIGTGTFS